MKTLPFTTHQWSCDQGLRHLSGISKMLVIKKQYLNGDIIRIHSEKLGKVCFGKITPRGIDPIVDLPEEICKNWI